MSEDKRQVRATVTVTVNVLADSVWGKECSMGQIEKQAIVEVRGTLEKLFKGSRRVKLLTENKVVVIYVEPQGG